MVSRQTMRDT